MPQSFGRRGTAVFAFLLTLSVAGTALAQDDGARAYWKALDGANVVAFQFLPLTETAPTRRLSIRPTTSIRRLISTRTSSC